MKDLKDILNEAFLIKKHQNKINDGYVDLDLPSGIKWATCNIGANKPEDSGLLFQWGITDGYKYNDKNHKFLSKKDYVTTSGTEYEDGDILKPEDDAAYQETKGEFRMPTVDEIDELLEHTNNEWAELNGIKGRKFISKKDDSKRIFIPAAGYFDSDVESFNEIDSIGSIWSSSINDNIGAYSITFYSRYCSKTIDTCAYGCSVRGVLNK